MKTKVITIVFLLAVFLVVAFIYNNKKNSSTDFKTDETITNLNENIMNTLLLMSQAFGEGDHIPAKYTCDGDDINPPFVISGVPEGTQSITLIMDDPDVPKSIREDGIWDHWVVFNIPANTTEIKEGVEPEGIHGRGTSGNLGYHGPCPPDREHRYFFKLYALDVELNLEEGVSKKEVERAMEGHVIQQTTLIGLYVRK